MNTIRFPLLLLLMLSTLAHSAPLFRVPPAEQARRDALRQALLAQEQHTEMRAISNAQTRRSERAHAGDAVGVRESETALQLHQANLSALQREIALTSGQGATVTVRRLHPASIDAPPPFWDMYGHTRTKGAAATAAPTPAPTRAWDMYQPVYQRAAEITPAAPTNSVSIDQRAPPATPLIVYPITDSVPATQTRR